MIRDKLIYACDFETSYENGKSWVWSYGYSKLGQQKVTLGNNIKDFMEFALSGNSKKLYFHNLKYDGKFIMYYLFTQGYKQVKEINAPKQFTALIDEMGMYYSIVVPYKYNGRNKKATFLDSLKLFPNSLRQLAKNYNLETQKGELDYDTIRYENHTITQEEKIYLEADVIILRSLLEIAQNNNMQKMTIASNAIQFFKDLLYKEYKVTFEEIFPIINETTFDYLQKGYKGGCSMVNKKYRNQITPTNSYDVNSMYPHILRNKELPFGYPVFFKGKYQQDNNFPLYVQRIRCEFYLKPNKPPTIQVKNTYGFLGNEWVENSNEILELTLTNIDLQMLLENYDVYHLEYLDGYKFASSSKIFAPYIDHWYSIKSNSKNPSEVAIAKLYLNSLYGKFGAKPHKNSLILGLDTMQIMRTADTFVSTCKTVYIPVAMFVTSYARNYLLENIAKVWDDFLYCDTDSIHVRKKTDLLPTDNKKLGYFKFEYSGVARYIKQKTYIVKYDKEFIKKDDEGNDVTTKICCAGLNQDFIKAKGMNIGLNDFVEGATFPKLRSCNVIGGVALVECEHKITPAKYTSHTSLSAI